MDLELLRQTLESAVEGLLFPSESDEPFVWVLFPDAELSAEGLLDALHRPADTLIREVGQDVFWRSLDFEPRYLEIQAVLQSLLGETRVFRVGAVEVEIYILGQVEFALAGLKTISIET